MDSRSQFKYQLHWHTQFPIPGALASNQIFYQHLSIQELKQQFQKHSPQFDPSYLITSSQRFEKLKNIIQQDSIAQNFYQSLYNQAELLLQTAPPSTPERHTLQNRILLLGLIYHISQDERFFHRAWLELEQYSKFSTWMYTEKLDAGYILKGMGIGYTWFYDKLSAKQQEQLRTAVLQNAFWTELEVYRNPYREGLDAHYILQNTNHNVSINCGMILAACAMMHHSEMNQMCAEIIHSALWALENYLPEFLEHGCGKEGVYYWYWPMTSVMEIIFSLQSTFGTDFGISKTPGFEKMPLFPLYMTGASGKEFNWGNAWEDVFSISESFFAFSNLLQNSQFALCRLKAIQEYNQSPTPYDLLWYHPVGCSNLDLPLDMKFNRTESVGMFSKLLDKQALSLCIKGGFNNEVHTSLSGGSFVIDAFGCRWASLPSAEKYNVPDYWDYSVNGTRWTYYRMRAEGQNALVLNPSEKPDQDPLAFCPILQYRSEPDSCMAIFDLTPAFSNQPTVKKAWRGATLTQNRSCILLQDRVIGKNIAYWWSMHTVADIEISEDKQTAYLSQQGKKMQLCLDCNYPAHFQIMPAQPLESSPNPIENSPNPHLKKIAVHLENVEDLTLSVLFEPFSLSTIPLPVPPLEEWFS